MDPCRDVEISYTGPFTSGFEVDYLELAFDSAQEFIMEEPYVTLSYGPSGPEYFSKQGTCPKLFYENEAPLGQIPLLFVVDGGDRA